MKWSNVRFSEEPLLCCDIVALALGKMSLDVGLSDTHPFSVFLSRGRSKRTSRSRHFLLNSVVLLFRRCGCQHRRVWANSVLRLRIPYLTYYTESTKLQATCTSGGSFDGSFETFCIYLRGDWRTRNRAYLPSVTSAVLYFSFYCKNHLKYSTRKKIRLVFNVP